MITSGKEYYYSVSSLMVPKYMVSDDLPYKLEYFVDWVPKNTDKLKVHNHSDMKVFIEDMRELYTMLCEIYAHWLEMEAARILRLADINEKDLCINLAVPFIANLRTLAIDIQMAQNIGFEASYRQGNEIERCRDTISSLKIVTTLLASNDFEKAFDIIVSINGFLESEHSIPVVSSITSKNAKRATGLIEDVIDQYKEKIKNITTVVTEEIKRKKIVVVDDMPEMLTALNLMLEEHFHVFPFSDGSEALNFIDISQSPDAFLLDIEMPKMDGFTLARKIRARDQYVKTPIMFLTGNSDKENIMRAMIYDVKAFIVKPPNKDILITKINDCFR